MSWYTLLKHLHVTAVGLSFLLFALRGIWMLLDSGFLQRRWVRVLPHVIDSLLLIAGLSLAFMLGLYPFVNAPWLTAKVLALVLYILLGTVALKRGRTQQVRVGAWVLALLVFGYIVHTAFTKNPLPF